MRATERTWPQELLLVRHGESAGNVARDQALLQGLPHIPIKARDCDVDLSPLGQEQAEALGRWLANGFATPSVLLASPYVRAQETSRTVARFAGWDAVPTVVDERLREKELGLLDRLTAAGIRAQYPQEVALRDRLGKFYYRPPRGESWADVVLRLRSVLETIKADYYAERVVLFTHQVVILCLRYIIENLTEGQLLDIDRKSDVANCSMTLYRRSEGSKAQAMELIQYNFVAPLEKAGAPVTASSDAAQD